MNISFKDVNYIFILLGFIFMGLDDTALKVSLIIGTSGSLLFVIICSYKGDYGIWRNLAFLSFLIGMAPVLHGEFTFSVIFVTLFIMIFISLLKIPVTFLKGVLYTFWLILIWYWSSLIIEGHSLSFIFVEHHLFYIVGVAENIFYVWTKYLLLLGGYVASVYPLYKHRITPHYRIYYNISTLIVFPLTLWLQFIIGILIGLYQGVKNYIVTFRWMIQRRSNIQPEDKEEPAKEIYWFKASFTDWKAHFKDAKSQNRLTQKNMASNAGEFVKIHGWIIALIPFVVLKVASFSGYILNFIQLVIGSIIHLVVISIIAAPIYMYYAFFKIYDVRHIRTKQVATVCPSCYHRSTLPVYVCYNCEHEHGDLRPGRFGIRKRTCLCGEKLPTTTLDQRQELQAKCKNEACEASIHTKEATPVCISIVGGPSAGKTSYVMTALQELKDTIAVQRSWETNYLHVKDEESFKRPFAALKQGNFPNKTAEKKPYAYSLKLASNEWKNPKALYMYDPAGEVYRNSNELQSHNYFEYVDGYVLMIDPFSLPELAASYESNEQIESVNPSDMQPEDAYDILMVHLAKKYEIKEDEQLSIPLAVVINKVDAFDIEKQIVQDESGDLNEQCRAFLIKHGYSSLVRRMESKFKNFSFFISSASPSTSGSSTSIDNSQAITWLLDSK